MTERVCIFFCDIRKIRDLYESRARGVEKHSPSSEDNSLDDVFQ